MKNDLISVIKIVAKFIGYEMTELQVLQLNDHLYIDNFRKIIFEEDPKLKTLIRKGQVGDWKNYFNEENNKIWNKWINDNLQGTDISFPKY